MHRFLCNNISGNEIIINDLPQIRHIKTVLHLKPEDEVTVFDDKGNEYACVLKQLHKDKIILEIRGKQLLVKKDRPMLTIACAIPKKAKMDDIVDKLTQLGVDRIIPLETQRVIVKMDKDKKLSRLIRWKKITQEASKQSQRNAVPVVEPIKTMREALAESGIYDLKLIPTLEGLRKTLKEALALSPAKNVLIFIGPEGDFSPQEVQAAIEAGCIPVTLGNTVLRVDTAAIAVASYMRLRQ